MILWTGLPNIPHIILVNGLALDYVDASRGVDWYLSCSVGFGAYSFFNINLAFKSVCKWILQYRRLGIWCLISQLLDVLQRMFWLQAYSRKVLAVWLHCCHELWKVGKGGVLFLVSVTWNSFCRYIFSRKNNHHELKYIWMVSGLSSQCMIESSVQQSGPEPKFGNSILVWYECSGWSGMDGCQKENTEVRRGRSAWGMMYEG